MILLHKNVHENDILSVEVSPNNFSDTILVLFNKTIVEKFSPELNLNTPSILFSSYNVTEMRENLLKNGVNVGEIVNMNGQNTFNFSDPEGNYFAVEEIIEK